MMAVWADCDQPDAPREPEEPQPRKRESCQWGACGERWCETCWPELHERVECPNCGEYTIKGDIDENGGEFCQHCRQY